MIALTATTHLIRFRLDSGTTEVQAFCTGRNITSTAITPINTFVNSNGTSNVTICGSPAASQQNETLMLSFFNTGATSRQVIVEFFDGTNGFRLFTATIAQNEKIEYKDGWRVFANTGAVKQSINQGSNAPLGSGLIAVVLASDVTNNNAVANTIQDVTGLSASFLAGKTYYFKFVIWYTAAATTTGSRWAVNASAGTAANLSLVSEYSLTTTTTTRNALIQAFDSPAASNATSASIGNNMAILEGYFRPTADCTFIARFASEVAASAIVAKAGSILYYQQTD